MKSPGIKYTTYEKMVMPILAFAFFWLVIGDLIIIHERAIFGFDPFTKHIPFAKPDKSSSIKLYKDEGQRIIKSKFCGLCFTANADLQSCQLILPVKTVNYSNTFSILKSKCDHPLIELRGPPSC